MNSNRTRDIIVGAAVIIILILIAVYFIRRGQSAVSTGNNTPLPTPVTSYEQDLQNNFGITVPNGASTANLKDVNGGNQIGLATLDKSNGQNAYTILANLEDPAPGYFYQAWIVNGNDTISLGKLSVAKAGWLVNFNSSKDLSDKKTVWITLEKVNDNTPEKHILEGTF